METARSGKCFLCRAGGLLSLQSALGGQEEPWGLLAGKSKQQLQIQRETLSQKIRWRAIEKAIQHWPLASTLMHAQM